MDIYVYINIYAWGIRRAHAAAQAVARAKGEKKAFGGEGVWFR